MNNNDQQPVAYDVAGRPLYAHPATPQSTQPSIPPVVQVIRPITPQTAVLSPEEQQQHDESKLNYPTLNLSNGEFIISAVRRHPIGLVVPIALGTFLIGVTLGVLLNYAEFAAKVSLTGFAAETTAVTVPMLLFCVVVALGMFISWYVYVSNKFFLTNESVIQEIQYSLFSRLEQTVSLGNIEDASYTQVGVLQQIFNYGDIRLSTEGDETTYRFSYVANPKEHIKQLNNSIEAFKNGRPVSGD